MEIPTGIIEAGSSIIGGVIGMAGQNQREKKTMQNQKKLMGLQYENQRNLNIQAKELALQQWKDTNYKPQVEEMKKAGLNVGLMYGMGGGGGATSNAGSGGSASGGSAPSPQPMGIDAGTLASIGLMLAQTEKTKAEAEKIKETDTANVTAETELTKMKTENQKIMNEIGNKTIEDVISGISANANTAISEARIKDTSADVNKATKEEQISKIKSEAINEALKAGAIKSGIELNDAQINKISEDIRIGKFNASSNAENIGLDKVAGKNLNKLIEKIYSIFGIDDETQKTIK